MKAYTISNGFRQGREAAFGALLMELCIGDCLFFRNTNLV